DLVVESGPAQAPGCISRRSVEAVWSRLAARGKDGPADLLRRRRPDGGLPRSAALEFWRACASAIGAALADETGPDALGAQPGLAEDAQEMAVFLEMAEDALEIRERFPRPQGMLPASALNELAVMFDDFADRHPGRGARFFLLLAGRLENPWQVLDVMEQVAGRVHSGRLSAADTETVMEALFAELDAGAQFFRRLNTTFFDPVRVADALRAFTRRADGLAGAVPEGGRWARRMAACRSDVAEKMEILMERAPRDIMAALPLHKIGRFGRVRRRPDISMPPDEAKSERALRMAKLLDSCRAHASGAAFKAAYSEAAADVREGLSEYAGALIEEMARHDAEFAASAQSWLDLVIRLTAHAAGPEEAGRLRRDAASLGVSGLPGAAVS
ncbi:MAG: hypothetical protein ACLFV8_08755, partial [Alphaproteobacteria bacterium]